MHRCYQRVTLAQYAHRRTESETGKRKAERALLEQPLDEIDTDHVEQPSDQPRQQESYADKGDARRADHRISPDMVMNASRSEAPSALVPRRLEQGTGQKHSENRRKERKFRYLTATIIAVCRPTDQADNQSPA